MADDLRVVYASGNEIEARLCKSLLDEDGVPCVLETLPNMWGQHEPWLGQEAPRYRIVVPAEHAAYAAGLIEAYLRPASADTDGIEPDEDGE